MFILRNAHPRELEFIVENTTAADWEETKRALASELTKGSISSDHVENLRIALGQRSKDRILEAVAELPGRVLDAPAFKDYLDRTFKNENSRGFVELGYQIRIIEREAALNRTAIPPLKEIQDILRSGGTSAKNIEIAEYLDNHDKIGLGLPIRPYVLAGFDLIRSVFDEIVSSAIRANHTSVNSRESHAEVYHRLLAHGYAHRIAEELTYGSATGPEPNNSGVSNSVWPDTAEKAEGNCEMLWQQFSGEPNTDRVLRAKAEFAAVLITMSLDRGVRVACDVVKIQNIRFGEEELLAARMEMAAVLLHLADRFAFRTLPENGRNVFMEALEVNVIAELADHGIDTSYFMKVLHARHIEYYKYKKFIADKGDSCRGTLFCEFPKNVATALCIGENFWFNQCLSISTLRQLKDWNLTKLMKG